MQSRHPQHRNVKRARGTRRVASFVLLVYLGLLLQPCAVAMGHEAAIDHDTCHEVLSDQDDAACLSQPALECSFNALLTDARDSWQADFKAQLVTVIEPAVVDVGPGLVAEFGYFSRAPPSGGPALNVRHCVYLK